MPLQTEKLRLLMRRQNISQRDLAKMSGVTEAAMSRYVSGARQPKAETLANMAVALHVTSADLLGMEPPSEIDGIYRLVARNAAAIPHDMRLKLMQILSMPTALGREYDAGGNV